jgi:ABC-type amino acid transport substrate-binding protein
MTISEQRRRVYQFTESYNSYEFVIFVHRDSAGIGGQTPEEVLQSLQGRKVGLLRDSIEGGLLRATRQIQLVEMSSVLECLERLAAEEVEACSATLQTGLYYVRDRELPVVSAGVPIAVRPYATGVTPHFDGSFVAHYNAVLEQMRADGTLAALTLKWFGSGGMHFE